MHPASATANPFAWKPDWPQTRQHFLDWWAGTGTLVASIWPPTQAEPIHPGWSVQPVDDIAWRFEHGAWRGREQMDYLARMRFPGDTLPAASLGFGPGCLSIFAKHGCTPHTTIHTTWYQPVWEHLADPETAPVLEFDADGRWWQTCVEMHAAFNQAASGLAMPVIPDLGCGLDILSSLRGAQTLLTDLIERPQWVLQKQEELLELWSQVYDRCVQLSPADGGNACESYRVWGPGRTAMFFCDFAAMISPRMFRRFEAPFLARGCERVEHSYFHLDGHECLGILDALLEIPRLGAVEWTPSPNKPHGASPCYDEMINRIRNAGKSVILIETPPEAIIPLFDRIGAHGLYVHTDLSDPKAAETLMAAVDRYR